MSSKTSKKHEVDETPFGPGFDSTLEAHERDPDYDGRLLRGERTRRHIAQAMIDLIEEGDPRPTARLIAERAGVSLRLVFHHFDDVEAIFQEGAIVQAQRHWRRVVTIPSTGPVVERIEAVCRQRRQLYVSISPVRRAVVARAAESTSIQQVLAVARRRLREELAITFEPELTRAGAGGPVLLDAIELATSWESWDGQRTAAHRSAAASQRVMRFTLTALLV
jgi:AcrR family transcriptional regulator